MRFSVLVLLTIFVTPTQGTIGLLDLSDYQLQQSDSLRGPALSSGIDSENPWESYNQWRCYPLDVVEFGCVVYDEDVPVPTVVVATEAEVISYDVHFEENLECNQTLREWNELVSGGNEVCLYAAHMPAVEMDLDEDTQRKASLWYIDRIKGFRGTWVPMNADSSLDDIGQDE